jgi:WD40 repeat protein
MINYGYLNSACFLNDNNKSYIIVCFAIYNTNESEPIKVFDFKGNKIKEINDSKDSAYYIDNYYDNDLLKNYILTGNLGYIKSYDYNENKIYHKYYENNNIYGHLSLIINKKKEITEIIESSYDGNIRIWNFHTGIFIRIIKASKEGLRDICMRNNEYLLVGCDEKKIKLINLNNGEIIKEIEGHNNKVLSLKIIFHPIYEKCLISQGADFEPIKLWIIKS